MIEIGDEDGVACCFPPLPHLTLILDRVRRKVRDLEGQNCWRVIDVLVLNRYLVGRFLLRAVVGLRRGVRI
jgi:hypothetical protein